MMNWPSMCSKTCRGGVGWVVFVRYTLLKRGRGLVKRAGGFKKDKVSVNYSDDCPASVSYSSTNNAFASRIEKGWG